MTRTFDGQAALVTGAGSGMGLATASAFAEAGASVVLAGITHLAIWEALGEGPEGDWGQQLSDAEYLAETREHPR